MEQRVPIRTLNQETSAVLDAVARGTSVVITRNGVPVARLVPVEPSATVIARLVTSGRAIAPTMPGPVPTPTSRVNDGIDVARALTTDRLADR